MIDEKLMSQRTMLLLILYHVVLGLIAIYIIFSIWPGAAPINENRTISLFFGLLSLNLDAELTLILVAISAGVIGAFIQSLGSIAKHRAQNDLGAVWSAWYLTRSFLGAGLALAIYLVLRAGFINMSADAASISLFGTAGISVICGMFTDKATEKLKEVANTLLKTEGGTNKPVIPKQTSEEGNGKK